MSFQEYQILSFQPIYFGSSDDYECGDYKNSFAYDEAFSHLGGIG